MTAKAIENLFAKIEKFSSVQPKETICNSKKMTDLVSTKEKLLARINTI